MKGEIHGINCSCCKVKSPEAKAILEEINSAINSVSASSIETERAATIKLVKEYETLLSPIADISPLVALTEEVFSLPEGDLNFEMLELENPEKKIGSFLAREISEHPGIDVTKLMDFSRIDVTKLKELKIGLTIPTITATLDAKIGPIGLGITFRIGINTFSWSPETKYKNPIDALKALEGQTFQQILSESDPSTLSEIKNLARRQLSDNLPVLESLLSTDDKQNFFSVLNREGLNITKEIDVAKEATDAYNQAVEYEEILRSTQVLPTPSETLPSDIKNIELCPENPVIPSPYTNKEVERVRDEVCDPVEERVETPVLEIPNVVIPDQNEEITKIQSFLSDIKKCSDLMTECSKNKQKSLDRWYAAYELKILNTYTLRYFESLRDSIEGFYGEITSILRERDSKINDLLVEINNSRPLYSNIEEYNESPRAVLRSFALDEDGKPLASYVRVKDPELISMLINQRFLAGTNKNDAARQAKYKEKLREIQNTEKTYNEYKATLNRIFANSVASSKIETIEGFRRPLYMRTNPITNLIGYVRPSQTATNNANSSTYGLPSSSWKLKVSPINYQKIYNYWNEAVNSPGLPEMGGASGVSEPLKNYVSKLDIPLFGNGGSLIEDRRGLIEERIWKKFYSIERYDAFFSSAEQGYNKPKPSFDQRGRAVGKIVKKKITQPNGQQVTVDLPESAEGLEVDDEKAQAFWETSEDRLKTRIQEIADSIINGSESRGFNEVIYTAAKKEAAFVFFSEIENRSFLEDPRTLRGISHVNDFRRKAYVIDVFNSKISQELIEIQKEIDEYQACIDENQKCIITKSKALATTDANDSQNLKAQCAKTLGSNPVSGLGTGRCPSYAKDCYWKEYTKLMQKVSLMPIPELDPQNITKRLFRYYPVAVQIPVPTPTPGVLPTLASGIPDPLISIPLPLIWKHVITVPTPLGIVVIWIAFAGPILSPFIMLIDEKQEATFMLTSRGPCSIPHPSVAGTNPLEKKSLIETVLPPGSIRVDTSTPVGKLLCGSNRNDTTDPDTPKNVIDKFKEKIKSSFDELVISDIDITAGLSPAAQANKEKIRKAFESVPPDQRIIEDAIKEVKKKIADSIDKIKVSGIKFPKDDKKLITPVLGPSEIIDQLTKAIDTAASAPGEIANQALKDLGAGVKSMNMTKKLKEKVLQKVDTPETKKFLQSINEEIGSLESRFAIDPRTEAERLERVKLRAQIIKKMIKKPIQEVADEINPEEVGFVAKALNIPTLPFPCYKNVSFQPVPPYVYLIIAAIKAAPSIIDSFSDEKVASLVSFEIDVNKRLPDAEKLFYKTINGILDGVPNIEVPDSLSDNMFKETVDMVKQIPFKFKVRLPKKGLPTQIEIPGSLVKTIMKQAASAAVDAVTGIILSKLGEAIASGKSEKVVAVMLIIKGLFGVTLEEIKGQDIKSFIGGMLESVVFPSLDQISSIVNSATRLKGEFLSVIELFQFPPKLSLPGQDGPFYEVGTEQLRRYVDPIVNTVLPGLFAGLPYPVTLLGCSSSATRLAFTKIHPLKAKEVVPSWEGLSLNNIPFVIWLDQLIGTAQRKSGLGSTYLASAGGYQAFP